MKDGDKDSGSAKSAISPGQITITNPEGQNQDLAALNHDTTNTNDEIKVLPDLQAKLNVQLKTQQEWTQAAANMATGVKKLSNKLFKDTNNPMWDEGGVARAALHAIAGGLLGGVNGVDAAIKSAIAAGVSTLIAPYINDIVKDAVAQSGLTGEDAKRMSDTLTSSIVLGLLAGTGGSDAAAYASNEIKYNYLKEDQWKEYLDQFENCGSDSGCKEEVNKKFNAISSEWRKCETSVCIKEYWEEYAKAKKAIDSNPELKQRIEQFVETENGAKGIWYLQDHSYGNTNISLENYQIAKKYAGLSYCEQNPGNSCQKIGEDGFAQKYLDSQYEIITKGDFADQALVLENCTKTVRK